MVTGEEGERHVAQVGYSSVWLIVCLFTFLLSFSSKISCKLFMFDSASRNWREKGRGELRLNDMPKSEGAYQSRLIMRAGGSRRVFLNTHLWLSMKCERANERSIRLTAQEPDGGFGVYLVKVGVVILMMQHIHFQFHFFRVLQRTLVLCLVL